MRTRSCLWTRRLVYFFRKQQIFINVCYKTLLHYSRTPLLVYIMPKHVVWESITTARVLKVHYKYLAISSWYSERKKRDTPPPVWRHSQCCQLRASGGFTVSFILSAMYLQKPTSSLTFCRVQGDGVFIDDVIMSSMLTTVCYYQDIRGPGVT